jgi:hypothetical protein
MSIQVHVIKNLNKDLTLQNGTDNTGSTNYKPDTHLNDLQWWKSFQYFCHRIKFLSQDGGQSEECRNDVRCRYGTTICAQHGSGVNRMNNLSSQHLEIKMVSRHRKSGSCTVFVGWWAFKWSPITPLARYRLTPQNSSYPTHPPSHTFEWAPSISLTSRTWKGLTAYIAHAGSSVPHCTANSQVCISNINLQMALNGLILFVCHTHVFSGPSRLKSADV